MEPDLEPPQSATVTATIRWVLDWIEHVESVEGLNAFITVDREGAVAAARAADERRATGRTLGPLDGVPIAVKDNLDTAGLRTTFGLGVFADRVPEADAEVVRRLRNAGAIIVGKTNMTELACGTVGVNEHYGDTQHPIADGSYPGGSSSGSAAIVGRNVIHDAIGTDTGGSIRQPAAACGRTGLKPTFGRVSNDGVSVCARTMDHVGPIGFSAAHTADVLQAIQIDGLDDPTERLGEPITGARVAVLTGEFLQHCEADVLAAFEPAIRLLEELGATIGELDLGLDLRAIDDGVANVLGADLLDEYGELLTTAGPGAFGRELWSWYSRYEGVDADARATAVAEQQRLTWSVADAMAGIDVVLCPTTRTGIRTIAAGQEADRFERVGNLALWDLTGQPSITVPFGVDAAGNDLGLLITGHRGADARVLQIADAVEQASRFAAMPGRWDRSTTRFS
ncbi:MAG: amidase [Actinomycetota bacterium]